MFWFTDTTNKLEVGGGNGPFRLTRKGCLFAFGSSLPQNNQGKKTVSDNIKLLFHFQVA